MRHFTQEELKFVKTQLELKVPYNKFLKEVLHCDGRTFKRMCLENGFEYPNFRKRIVNHNPFLDLNNPNVMYWLGWLATDGYINHKESRISLGLSVKDLDVVKKFRDFISPKLKIVHSIQHGQFEICQIAFRNKIVTDYLYNLGFKENKTFNFIPNFKITWDYIRGVFEGDGYFRWGHPSELNIASACKQHLDIIKNFTDSFGIKSYIREILKENGTVMYNYEIYTKEFITKFIDYIYQDAETFMNRKFTQARIASNSNWKALKFGEPASGIPSQASPNEEGVTT